MLGLIKTPLLKIINSRIELYPSLGDPPQPTRCLGSEGVSWVNSLGSEAAMFLGLLSHALTWNRPQRFLNDKVDVFTFLTHIIKYLFIIATNHWVHCNCYKHW